MLVSVWEAAEGRSSGWLDPEPEPDPEPDSREPSVVLLLVLLLPRLPFLFPFPVGERAWGEEAEAEEEARWGGAGSESWVASLQLLWVAGVGAREAWLAARESGSAARAA